MMRLFLASLLMFVIQTASHAQIPDFYKALENHFNKNEFEECIKFEEQVNRYAQQQKDTLLTNSYYYLADSHYQLGDTDQAIVWRERQTAALMELGLEDWYSTALYNLTYLYLEAGIYDKAEISANTLLSTDKKLFGVKSEEYASSAITVSDIYLQLDKLDEAQKLITSTLRDQEKGSVTQALLLNKAGDICTYTGEFSKAQRLLSGAMEIFNEKLEATAIENIAVRVNLGILHMEQGKFPEAEEDFEEALRLMDSPEHPNYYPTLNNLALVYQSLGQFERAEKTFSDIREAEEKSLGANHPSYAVTLSNLSLVYNDEAKYPEAERTIQAALEIQRRNEEVRTASYARKLNNLAKVYVFSGLAERAIPLYVESLGIFKEVFGEESADYATVCYNLGVAYLKARRADEGIEFLRKSASLRAKVLGRKHPKYAESKQKIAEYQWMKKQRKEARASFDEVFENYYAQIESVFPVLTEEEKSKFYFNTLKPSFEKYNSFALEFYRSDASILGDVYNHQLNTKAVIMLATEKVKQSFYETKNEALISRYEEWQGLKEKLAKLQSQNENPATLDSLLAVANAIEKELVRQSSTFANQYVRKRISWQEVQKGLKPGEAAVEVIRFNNYVPEDGGKFTDLVMYALLVVTPQTKTQPDIIILPEGKDLEGRFLKFHRNSIQLIQPDDYSYKKYFEPLGDFLKKRKITKFYISPDGVFNQINLNTIRNITSKQFLIDEFDIIQVTNTREIAEKKSSKSQSQSSILIGFPKFNLEENQLPQEEKIVSRSLRPATVSRGLRGGLSRYVNADNGISVLPGTKVEINEINNLFRNGTQVYLEHEASEALTKSIRNPKILHVATHGYFLEDDQKNKEDGTSHYVFNPLLKSGLILAGAENFLKTGTTTDPTGQDGVLTAYEAMNLHLEQTDIVVLSACETGLGDIKNGEGVYGLQRAFKLSGARCVVMSLWSVDDEATKQLMIYFYQEFLQSNDPHESLRKAQKKLMKQYPDPYYWGAFVVVGI